MIAKLKSLVNCAFSNLTASNSARDGASPMAANSTAERIGPHRVIITARMNSGNVNEELGPIGLGVSFRGLSFSKADEETVNVPVESSDNDNDTADADRVIEKRATLSVKSETKYLTVNFTCKNNKVLKTERIKIK